MTEDVDAAFTEALGSLRRRDAIIKAWAADLGYGAVTVQDGTKDALEVDLG